MNIYIAKDFDNNPIGVLLADDKNKAEIAFYAMGEVPKTIEEIDPNDNLGVAGVAFLLTSTKMNSSDFSHRISGIDFRQWKRGL